MTGSAEDGPEWQKHIGNKKQRRDLANQFKDAKNPFKIVIVRDMWLTGFDAPCLHTMYADKPMQGHGLMQAIARVNRVFRDKPGGLVVDYLGLADQLKKALITYTESGGQGNPTFDTAQAIAVMLEKHCIACDMMHGFHWDKWTSGKPTERLALIPAGQEHILEQEDGKKRWGQVVTELSRALMSAPALTLRAAYRQSVSLRSARPLRRQRCRNGDPRRRELLPGPASRAEQAEQQQPEDARADRRRHPPAREQGHHHRRPGDRRLHRRGIAQAGHLTPSPPAQSGCAQHYALSVSVAPHAPSAAS